MLSLHIEALVFSAIEPISISDIRNTLQDVFETSIKEEDIINIVGELQKKYSQGEHAFSIEHVGGGYIFMSLPAYNVTISKFLKTKNKRKLSNATIETLAIIAYEQPVIKSTMEKIRGVNCDYSVQKLLEKGLIEIQGKSDDVGRPLLYGTSLKFMEYFGINNINQLPELKHFEEEVNTIGAHNEG